jgi:hypothetical protein
MAALIWDRSAPAADPKRAALGFVALGVLGVAVVRSRSMQVSLAAWAWIGMVGWSALSIAWGGASGWRDVATWGAGATLIAAGSFISEADRRRSVGLVSALIGGISGLIAVVQVCLGARGIYVHAGQGNGNWLGLMLAVTLPLAADELVRTWSRRAVASWLCVVGVGLQSIGLILSHSRVAWAALAVALLAWILSTRLSLSRRLFAVTAAACLFGAIGSPTDAEVGTAWQGRVWIWKTSASVATEDFPLGTGMGRFPHRFLEVQGTKLTGMEPNVASRTFANATTGHNEFVQIAAELGPLGLIMFVVALGASVLSARRSRWAGAVASLVALAVCAWGDSPLRQPAIVGVFGLLIGALPARTALNLVWLKRAAVVGALASAVTLAGSVSTWMSSRWQTRARSEPAEEAIVTLQRATRADPTSGEAALALGLAWLEVADTARAIGQLERSKARLANVGTEIALGNAFLRASRVAEAVDAYERAIALHPGAFRAHANLGEALRLMGRLDDAGKHLAIARSLWPGSPHLPELEERLKDAVRLQAQELAAMPR